MNHRGFHALITLGLTAALGAASACGDHEPTGDPPQVTLTAPRDGDVVQGDVTVTAEVAGEVLNVALVVDGAVEQTLPAPPWSFTWASDAVDEGEHTLQVVAYGSGGLRGPSAEHQILVDRTAPTLTAPELPLPIVLTGSGNGITFEAQDAGGLATLRLLADDASQGECSASPCTISYDASSRDDGPVVLRMEAEDLAGNVSSASLPALVVNQGQILTFIEGTDQGVFQIPEDYATAEIDVKRHVTMPADISEILVAAQWDHRDWPFELSLGTGECPHSGTQHKALEGDGGQVTFRFAAADLSAQTLPEGQWFLHLGAGAALDLGANVGGASRLGFVAVIY